MKISRRALLLGAILILFFTFDEAVQTAQKAIGMARASGQGGLAQDMENRILLYKAGKPFYEG